MVWCFKFRQMEKVRQLRQVSDPKEDREYWMAFSNKNRTVKAGDRVTIVIGEFRAKELVVESGLRLRSR
jgi:hypothetical protein